MTNEALESLIRYARVKLITELSTTEDKTEGIVCRGLIPVYEQNRQYAVGDVRLHPETGYPRECMTALTVLFNRTGRLIIEHCGSHGTPGRKNMRCRGKRRPGHMICTRREST